MKKSLILLLIHCFVFSALIVSAQRDTIPKAKIIPLPIVFFTPETSWGFGGAGLYSFKFKNNIQGRPSQLQLGFAYTLRNQLLSYLPFQLFLKNDKYKLYGELGYYRYVYEFSGIGNKGFKEDSELFSVNFPRVRFNALQQIKPDWFVGIRYWMDDYDIIKVESDGLLAQEDIVGAAGGFLSGLGLVSNYDTRDQIFYPGKGLYIENVLFFNQKAFGSDFNYYKFIVDANWFKTLRQNHILGLNLYAELTGGDPPFNQLSLLGGPKKMRGYFEGAWRDKQYIAIQAEYRFPIIWRFSGTLFGTYGTVASDLGDIDPEFFRYTIGGGIRFLLDPKQLVNIRLDAGFGKNTSGFYLTVGEAF